MEFKLEGSEYIEIEQVVENFKSGRVWRRS